jgi:hypothetical protein
MHRTKLSADEGRDKSVPDVDADPQRVRATPFDVEILVGVTFIGAIVALGVAYYFLR